MISCLILFKQNLKVVIELSRRHCIASQGCDAIGAIIISIWQIVEAYHELVRKRVSDPA
jgi:hypothetical protein